MSLDIDIAQHDDLDPVDRAHRAAAIAVDLLGPAGRSDPYRLYADLRALGPVTGLVDSSYLVTGYDALNRVLREPGFGLPDPASSGRGESESSALGSMAKSILRANPPAHGRMRSLMSRVFTPRRVADLQPAIEVAVDDLLDHVAVAGAGKGAVDFMEAFAFPLPVTVICELLGVPGSDREGFRPLAADLTEALELSSADALPETAARAAEELAVYFTDLVGQKRTMPSDDLIGALVAARDAEDGRLSDDELLANLIMLLVAGFETTTSLLGNGLSILLDQPQVAGALREGEITVGGFVEEVLRFDSPVQLTTRVARADGLSVAGQGVHRGSGLILLIGAANRDTSRYAEPDRFDASRADIRPLSFGVGPHICLGNGLARLEARIAFQRLLARFERLERPSAPEPTRRDRLVLRGYETLPIVLA